MDIVHQGKFKHVKFTFAVGDLFEAKVDAIVSSEQTDFVLSGNPESISGQIWCRYGDLIQQELDQITKSQVLCAGTVIDTSGGKDFKRIFHAGFHKPDDWPGMANSSQDADYFEAIGSCVGQVLESVRTLKLSSVAFPLIGCGIFGLDEKMLILQFLDAIESLDGRLQDGEELNVWLVILNPAQFRAAAGKFLELLLAARREMVAFDIDPTSVPILDRFAAPSQSVPMRIGLNGSFVVLRKLPLKSCVTDLASELARRSPLNRDSWKENLQLLGVFESLR
jgi:O-acetyl-ADP-ribose deacetylase (regulator of RNase III)